MGSGSLLLPIILEPILLDGGSLAGSSLALDLDGLGLVVLQLRSQVGLLGRWRGLGNRELVNVGVGVGSLDLGGLVGADFLEVEVLDEVGWLGG